MMKIPENRPDWFLQSLPPEGFRSVWFPHLCKCGAPASVTFCRFPVEEDEHFCVGCLDIPEEWRERWWNFLKELAFAGTTRHSTDKALWKEQIMGSWEPPPLPEAPRGK